MRFLPLALVLPLVLPLTCAAQVPLIGTLDLYGVRKVSESRIRQTLGVKPGDPLPPSKGDTEERLDAIPGVVESHLEAVCCDQGKVILYVGIEERGAAHFDIRDNPDGEMRLPEEVAASPEYELQVLGQDVKPQRKPTQKLRQPSTQPTRLSKRQMQPRQPPIKPSLT